MKQEIEIPQAQPRHFLTKDFDTSSWESIVPFYQNLLDRIINSAADLQQWLSHWSELETALEEDGRWKYIKTTTNTADTKAQAELANFYQNIYPKISPIVNQLEQKFISSPFAEQLDQKLFFTSLRRIRKQISLFRKNNVALLSELSVQQNEFGQITGAQSIRYKGKELTLQQASALLKSNNRQEREEIYRLTNERRCQDADKTDNLLSELIRKRHQVALNAGYKNYIAYRFDELNRFDYSPSDCFQFHRTVKETILPLVNLFSHERQEQLNLPALRPWDLEVDTSGKEPLHPFATTDELIDKTIQCFNCLDPYFGDCIAIMRQMNRLDLDSRMNKAPGGYNISLPETGAPFIFMNAANTEHDLVTMVHEGGHAIHAFLTRPLALNMFKEIGAEIAEVASMSMELLSMEHWSIFYPNPEDLNRAKKNHLQYIVTLLSKIPIGDSFQFWLYENPEHTVAERRKQWFALSEQFSADNKDWTGLEEWIAGGYQRILHFYEVPFYYIEYAFAQLGALAIWRNFKQNPQKAIEQYKHALSLGATCTIPEFYEAAGARFDFSQAYLAELMGFVTAEIKKLY